MGYKTTKTKNEKKVQRTIESRRIDKTTFFYYAFRNILLVSLLLLFISGFILSLPHSSAVNNSSTDSVSINLPISCTLSASGSSSHNTSMVSGQLKEDIGLTEINTLCNDKNGYVIYAKGITQNSNNEVVLSSTIGPNYDIKTGNIPTTNNNSSWAFKLSAISGDYAPTIENTYNNQYAPVPNTWTKVVSRSSGTSTNTDISNTVKSAFTTTYAVYTTPSQPAGTYSGQVQFILLHPSTADKISPDINTAFFNANKSTVSVLDPETGEYGDFYKMQDMDSGICGSVIQDGEITTAKLVDIRDDKLYYVTKLKDGNCWMTQNLALDLETTPNNVAPLTSENTDLNDNSLSGAYELGYTYENNIITWKPANGTTSSWLWSNTAPSSTKKTDDTTSGHASIGNYYNWTASIASNDSSTLTTSTYNNINDNPKNSVCPKGWRLPTISSIVANDEFTELNHLYNNSSSVSDANLIITPLYFVRSGFINKTSLRDYGTYSKYQSSTISDKNNSYYLSFNSSSVNSTMNYYYDNWYGYSPGKYYGFSVRCLAR